MPRNNFEIYTTILNKAKKGALKYHLSSETSVSPQSFNEKLEVLLEAGLLTIDESKLKICKTGERRNVLYKTTKKGNKFLQSFHELQNMLGEN